MKRLHLIILSGLLSLAATAQTISDAFYIYRNDGDFNAFFREEIDSMAYSCYDLDSILCDDYVTQLVYTPDSIYRIPLAAIDSVGFVRPETILQPNVRQMYQGGLVDYLQAVDGMSLLFQGSLPRNMYPKVGDVLLYTDFTHPLLSEGFAGKVQKAQMAGDVLRVDCDSIYDLFEIFEQLISIEKIEDPTASAQARRRVSGEWTSSRNPLSFNLGYSHPIPKGNASLSGSVDGTYIATVTYNITRKEQYISLRIDHDWQYGAHLNFKSDASFGTLKGPVATLPAIRFPVAAPVFKFQIAGAPFVKGEGNMELDFSMNSPAHSYRAQAVYRNGHFSGWNHPRNTPEGLPLSIDAAFSLNGSLQAGYMVDLWLGLDVSIKGFAKDFLKMGTGLDFYIGPKLTGDFSMKLGTENPANYYSIYKDSKLGLSLLTVDYEFFGEASLAGHKFPKAMFCNGTLQTPLYHEWYILPEFSDLSITKNYADKKATISTMPTRDILVPLQVGIGIYDSDNNLFASKYESAKYKRENEGFQIEQTFSSLDEDEEYTAKPFIKILGGEVPAQPEETFKLSETSCPDGNHPHSIDLGLPSGTLWACCNVGASKPEEYGGYYAWGETKTKSVYDWSTYQYYNSNTGYVNIGSDIAGTSYDAATANWGAPWQMPTLAQIQELLNNTTSMWTIQNGVDGRIFTGRNGGTVFLPAAGYRRDESLDREVSYGCYWSSSLFDSLSDYAHALYFNSGYVHGYYRRDGYTVRPVRKN